MNRLPIRKVPAVRVRRLAFTMIELVVVVLILGILSSVAAPRYLESMANYRAETVCQRIVADLKHARCRAQQTSANQTIVFQAGSNQSEISTMNDLDHPEKVYEHRLAEGVSQATLVSASFDSSSTLVFDIYGKPSNSGTIVFNAGGGNHAIQVEESGHIRQLTDDELIVFEQGL
jgi:prepilin-type N-terminal cleavage/methylation domain-containing protein